MTKLFLGVGGNLTLTLWVQIAILARDLVTAGLNNCVCLCQRDAWEWGLRNLDLETVKLLDLLTVLFLDGCDGLHH